MKILQYGIALLCVIALGGCSKGNSGAGASIDPVTKKHVEGWAANGAGGTHTDAYFASPASCEECHGKPSDPAGGISRVSCSNPGRSGVACHPSFPHNAGFASYLAHGGLAKAAAGSMTGMAHCQRCHGSSYTGAGSAPDCIGCHKLTNPSSNAPHAANWVIGNSITSDRRHSAADETNAPACAQCHLSGRFSHAAPSPPPAGTAPGCFNGTLCHNTAGHTFTVVDHMIPARSNLASCQSCHATPASGANPSFTLQRNATLTPGGCEKCHARPGIAHPYMWLPGRGGQPNTNHGNAQNLLASCGLCHGGNALAGGPGYTPAWITGSGITPACFSTPASSISGTTCHFTTPVNATTGVPAVCTSCHGAPPSGTVAPNRAFRHAGHFSTTFNLAGLTCSACHAGTGSGTATHATKVVFSPMTAPVAIDPKFHEDINGNIVPATYSPAGNTGKCTNVSCHGGKAVAFPVWKSATPALNQNNCIFTCHTLSASTPATYTGPYIGPFSGGNTSAFPNLHNGHVAMLGNVVPTVCLNCHASPGAGHFANIMLGKRALAPGFAAGTITGTGIISYSPTTGCVTTCHVISPPDPRPWH